MPTEREKTRVEIIARKPELRVRLGDREYVTDGGDEQSDGSFAVIIDGEVHRGFRFVERDRIWVRFDGRTHVVERASAIAAKGGKASKGEIAADMPGTVVAVHVKEGDRVATGDPLLTIESMKLQITIGAERDGVVAKIAVVPNATFDRGALLAVVRPEEGNAQ
jgi:acetyl/propionyl-CoA carboxylase alpha subunit